MGNPRSDSEGTLRCEVSMLNKKIDDFIRKGEDERTSLKSSLEPIVDLKSELSSCIKDLKSDVIVCSKLISHVETSTKSMISRLEIDNNALHRKLNRADLVVSGLPEGIECLVSPIIELGSVYQVPVARNDINHVCYINKRTSVLVKFNNVFVRDEIVKKYFNSMKTRPLIVSDLVKLDFQNGNAQENMIINKRVYLNDHYPPATGKLNAVCRRLLKEKTILKFRIINSDKPKAKLMMLDGKEYDYDSEGCSSLLKGSGGISVDSAL